MLTPSLIGFALALAPHAHVAVDDAVTTEASIPTTFVDGQPFVVSLTYTTHEAPGSIEAWQAEAAAFELNGAPLGDRSNTSALALPRNSSMTLTLDLSDAITSKGDFELKVTGGEPTKVSAYAAAPEGLDFMEMPVADLSKYSVLLRTNRGDMVLELYPDSAPNHVRNFLDLAYTGFYDQVLFHRVSPTFMIQGGDPKTKTSLKTTWGTGNGPRTLNAEFNDRKHERGTLSMARGTSVNSASSQFFIMTAPNPQLDHQYTVFGHLVTGYDTLDRIGNAPGRTNPRDGTVMPTAPQRIDKALVLVHE